MPPFFKRTVKVEPSSGWLERRTDPPKELARCLTMDNPSPVPPISRDLALSTRKNRSKMRSWASAGIPIPKSRTVISTCFSVAVHEMTTSPGRPEYYTALSIKFPRMVRTPSSSATTVKSSSLGWTTSRISFEAAVSRDESTHERTISAKRTSTMSNTS